MKKPYHRDTEYFSKADLHHKIQLHGRRFFIFATLYFLLITIMYYIVDLHWEPLDAFYFLIVTFSTVGYGDILPTTPAEKVLTCLFLLVGVTITANAVGVIASMRVEREKRLQRERSNSRSPESEFSAPSTRPFLRLMASIEESCREAFDRATGYVEHEVDTLEVAIKRTYTDTGSAIFGGAGTAETPGSESADPQRTAVVQRDLSVLRRRYKRDLQDMRWAALTNFMFVWALIIGGFVSMMAIENFTVHDSFFWAVTTITTVGYGDVVPTTYAGKIFTMFYILFGCAAMANTMSIVFMTPFAMRERKNEMRVVEQFESNLTTERFESLVANPLFARIPNLRHNADEIKKAEFTLIMLGILGKVKDEDVETAARIFERFDINGDGVLSASELEVHRQEAMRRDTADGDNRKRGDTGASGAGSSDGSYQPTFTPMDTEAARRAGTGGTFTLSSSNGSGYGGGSGRSTGSGVSASASAVSATSARGAGIGTVAGTVDENHVTPYTAMRE